MKSAVCLTAMVLCSPLVHAEQPLWELGLGLGALSVPHYRGSDHSYHWLLPIPYVVYRGELFRRDREGTRAVLLDTETVDIDLSVDGSPPARSRDDRARIGLPDLAAALELGPNVKVRLGKGPGWKLELQLPVRAAVSLERNPKSLGWTFNPVLNLDVEWQAWNLTLQGGPLAASQRYNEYFYSVAPAYATSTRPAYAARAGYAGWGLACGATRRVGDYWIGGFARYDSLQGATFAPSPLVTSRNNFTVGLAVSWVFAVSQTRVPDRR